MNLEALDAACASRGFNWCVSRSHCTLLGQEHSVYVVTLHREKGRVVPFVGGTIQNAIDRAMKWLETVRPRATDDIDCQRCGRRRAAFIQVVRDDIAPRVTREDPNQMPLPFEANP